MVGGAHVSRRHAEFSVRSGALYVKDLGSSNGTFVNGKRHDEILLKNGDEVKLDAMTFKVVGPAEPVAQTDFEEEAERTQFRPVVSAPAPKPAAPKPASSPSSEVKATPAPPPAPKPAPSTSAPAPAASTSSAPASGGGNNVGVMVVVVLIVLIVLAALFLF